MPDAAPKNWLERNWKWAVPTGCLTMLLLFAAGIALLFTLIFGMLKSSDVYKEAMARVQASSAVVEALGTPIEPGFLVSGNLNTSGPNGNASLSVPLSGPKAKGTLTLEARKAVGVWTFTSLVLELDGSGKRIDLLGGKSPVAPPDLPAPAAPPQRPAAPGGLTAT